VIITLIAGLLLMQARITTVAGVRVRTNPQTSASEITRLPFGTVLQEIGRSDQQEQIGASRDFWYQVVVPDKQPGWIFGGLTVAFDPNQRVAIYQRIIETKLKSDLATFADEAAFATFVERVLTEIPADVRSQFEFFRLLALQRAARQTHWYESTDAAQRTWVMQHDDDLIYSEPAGQWLVNSLRFWDLEQRHHGTALADDIAAAAAANGLSGECEGFLDCYASVLLTTDGRYLELYPAGAHTTAALQRIDDFLTRVIEASKTPRNPYEVYKGEEAAFHDRFKSLMTILSRVQNPAVVQILEHLRQVDTLIR
jgi:hypothetical protein